MKTESESGKWFLMDFFNLLKNTIQKRYDDGTTVDTASTSGFQSPIPTRNTRTNLFSNPDVFSSPSNITSSSATIISDITFQTPCEEEKEDWTDLQRRKIVEDTENLEVAIGTNPCCKKNCIKEFSLETIKSKRYTFHHLNNANKRYHLNLCTLTSTQNKTRRFVIDGISCCIECVTKVLGVSRKFIYKSEKVSSEKALDTKSSKIVTWLLDIAGFANRMPDQEEYHIPYMNKVYIYYIYCNLNDYFNNFK
jgi:hypothetical protein